MASRKFNVQIELGNAGMSSAEDVADVLEDVQHGLREGCAGGIISDVNGNHVGTWYLEDKDGS